MTRGSALVLATAVVLFAQPVSAEGLDTSRPLVCDLVEVAECDTGASCTDVSFAQIDLPPVVRLDFEARRVVSEDGQRSSPITEAIAVDGVLILSGHQEGRGWTMAIQRATGRLSAALVDAEGAFVIAGACVAD